MLKAVIYDFDGTLTPDALPEFEILEQCGLDRSMGDPRFMEMVKRKAQTAQVDFVRAAFLTLLDNMKSAGVSLTDDSICLGADKREFNPGVLEFLRKLRLAGVRNYVLSSGNLY